jgi:hypothetical protein
VAAALGSEADLDTHTGGQLLQRLLSTDTLTAVVQVEETQPAADAVFYRTACSIVVVRQSAWNAAAVRDAIVSASEGFWTTSRLGAE